ncbi:hypothetical protein AMTRI_Chr09g40190 [Amborella trichopoda]
MKILSWNIRGLGHSAKRHAVKDVTSRHLPAILALSETKLLAPTLSQIRQVWGRPCQWVALPALGALGGIWVIWNPSEHSLVSSHLGEFSVSLFLSHISDDLHWKVSAIYGPCSPALHPRLCSELDLVASLPHHIWCLGGDFNITRWSSERNSNSSISQGMNDFSDFMSRQELLDVPLQGCRFTWSNHSPQPSLSKLARFLFSVDWEETFPSSHAMALAKPLPTTTLFSLIPKPSAEAPNPFVLN